MFLSLRTLGLCLGPFLHATILTCACGLRCIFNCLLCVHATKLQALASNVIVYVGNLLNVGEALAALRRCRYSTL